MIAHVFRSYPAGNGRALATYVLDLKHERAGERLGPYISDPKKHKVEWSRTVNTNAGTPAAAISAIEQYNAQNLRWHKVSRMVHVVVSFPEGEKPTREQADIIEDRLMAAIGFNDHPRISALHRLDDQFVGNWHLHIAVSRINPVTFKAEHPRHNHFTLQAESARLEIDLGLRQERKTLLKREREEIDARRSMDRAVDAHHSLKEEVLEKASWADKVQSGLRPLMVEDVARMLEPKYAALIKRAAELREQAAKEERSRDAMEIKKLAAVYRVAERRAEIGPLWRAAHWLGTIVPTLNILRDLELHRWEHMRGGAAYMEDNKGIKQGAAEGELTRVTRLADQMLDPNHPIGRILRPSGLTLRQEAERELRHRQVIARNAREILVNSLKSTINRRRSHTLRSGP